jgi:hypothetical protein
MTGNNDQEKRHRGSSPPFQEVDNNTHKIAIALASHGQVGDEAPSRQLVMQYGIGQNRDSRSNDDSRLNNGSQSRSDLSNDGKSRSDKEDVSRWQDDGGESGEDV